MLLKDEQKGTYWIQAYRFRPGEVGSGRHEPCPFDDDAAVTFDVTYPGMSQGCAIKIDDKRLAERVLRACLESFEAGGQRKIIEFKRFLDLPTH
jgi:hypothetical protein